MDVFFEQIIVKKPKPIQKVLKIIMILLCILLIIGLVWYGFISLLLGATTNPLSSFLAPVCILAAFGVGFGARWYIKRMYMEYEYSITNGDFDIDRIIGKSKRQRMITTNCSNFEEFGVYDKSTADRFASRQFDAKVLAANLDDDGLYYAVVAHQSIGSVLVVIEPNERIVKALKKFVPRQVQKDVFDRD